uniref:Uncharacterized protein n=1 Tax=Ditylenchus dipsaci TaxID=166011 RepID=A0A915CRZ7_9BILA
MDNGHPFGGPRFRSIYNPTVRNAAGFPPPPTLEPLPNVDGEEIAAAAQAPDINHPTSSNLERYMPLLARKLGLTNRTAHSSAPDPATQMPIDWQEEEEEEEPESQTQSLIVPAEQIEDKEAEEPACVSAKCRTWITITIPEEGPIYPSLPKNKPEAPLPPINPLPQYPPKLYHPKRSTTLSPRLTTRNIPPDFVFSTSWILPLNKPPPGGNWVKPYTLKPRPKVPGITVTTGPVLVSGSGHKKNKPWTHSSSSGSSVKARPKSHTKNRPAPTPETSIEEAAIWASTELIDAIKLALDRFRASLNRDGTSNHSNDMSEVGAQLQTTWNQLRKGAWLERALAELAMSDATNKHISSPSSSSTPPEAAEKRNSAMLEEARYLPTNDYIFNHGFQPAQPAIQEEHLQHFFEIQQ